jgi:hypothetical protein
MRRSFSIFASGVNRFVSSAAANGVAFTEGKSFPGAGASVNETKELSDENVSLRHAASNGFSAWIKAIRGRRPEWKAHPGKLG